jgi:hypothetical protein
MEATAQVGTQTATTRQQIALVRRSLSQCPSSAGIALLSLDAIGLEQSRAGHRGMAGQEHPASGKQNPQAYVLVWIRAGRNRC